MHNVRKPTLEELPTLASLKRSALLAGVAGVAILVTVVLPAERAIDPTGIGRVLGLTEMGEIKRELAEEAEHHPAILTEWGKVTVQWWTHKIKGLHRNDFIMAAKTDDQA